MGAFNSKCPLCGGGFQAEDEWIGQVGECPKCGKDITIQGNTPITTRAIQSPPEIKAETASCTEDEKFCPYCGETIKKVAVKCKHCQSDLNGSLNAKTNGAMYKDSEQKGNLSLTVENKLPKADIKSSQKTGILFWLLGGFCIIAIVVMSALTIPPIIQKRKAEAFSRQESAALDRALEASRAFAEAGLTDKKAKSVLDEYLKEWVFGKESNSVKKEKDGISYKFSNVGAIGSAPPESYEIGMSSKSTGSLIVIKVRYKFKTNGGFLKDASGDATFMYTAKDKSCFVTVCY